VTDVCDFAISAPFRAGPSWIGLFCIFNGFVFDFWFLIFLVGVSPLLALVRFLLRMAGSEEVIDNEISYFAAQPVAGLRQAGLLFCDGRQSRQLERLAHLGFGAKEVRLWQGAVSLLAADERNLDFARHA